MRKQLFRLTNLRVTPDHAGVAWEAWVLVNGLGKCVRGRIGDATELPLVTADAIRTVYFEVTGKVLEDNELNL